MQESVCCPGRVRRGDRHGGAPVDVAHDSQLSILVVVVVLDDAEGIDPDVADGDVAGDGDGVLDGLTQLLHWDATDLLVDCPLLRRVGLISAPAVAERDVSCALAWRAHMESGLLVLAADIDYSRGQKWYGWPRTLVVVVFTLRYPLSGFLENEIAFHVCGTWPAPEIERCWVA